MMHWVRGMDITSGDCMINLDNIVSLWTRGGNKDIIEMQGVNGRIYSCHRDDLRPFEKELFHIEED